MAESLVQGEAEDTARDTAQPFTIRFDRVSIEGGYAKEFLIDTHELNGIHFFALLQTTNTMRRLAKAFGLSMDRTRPWSETDVIRYLTKSRNVEIDRLIRAHRVEADPMANVDSISEISEKGRAAAFVGARIPDFIDLVLSAFESDGKTVPSTTMKVVACPRRARTIEVELTTANLEWLLKASWHSWYDSVQQKPDMDQLPPLREDGDCYWRKRGDDYRIECKWKDHRTQRWKFASRVVHVDIDNRDFLEQMVAELEKKVQHAYDTRFDNTAGDAGIEQHLEDTPDPVQVFEGSPSVSNVDQPEQAHDQLHEASTTESGETALMTPQKRLFHMLQATPQS